MQQHLDSLLTMSAGAGLFLFAMYLMEHALQNLSGREFKRFLQKMTGSYAGAVTAGTLITGILQSSSMVSLMVLAMVGAGVFRLQNAMAMILGANLGTTLSSWLVVSLGFKLNIELAAYPLVCAGGLLLVLVQGRFIWKYLAYFLLGFGLLFVSLTYLKTAMGAELAGLDFGVFQNRPEWFFLLLGFAVTLLIQSSSLTMVLCLSALDAGAIGLLSAAAAVLGSETGTTLKILLGAYGNNATKKRVAFGNLLFNVTTTLLVFTALKPAVYLINNILNIKDPLIALVSFSSLTNLFTLILFLPVLKPFTAFLERRFTDSDHSPCAYLKHANPKEPVTAVELFEYETRYFLHQCMVFNLERFASDWRHLSTSAQYEAINRVKPFRESDLPAQYAHLKQHQGEIQSFYLALKPPPDKEQTKRLSRLVTSVRSGMYAVKGVKDIDSNLFNLSRSSKNFKYAYYLLHKKQIADLYEILSRFVSGAETCNFAKLKTLYLNIQEQYREALNFFYNKAGDENLGEMDFTTVLNFNRELFTSHKAMVMAVKDLLLTDEEAEAFNELPEYKT